MSLLGLVYAWGDRRFLRPVLRTDGWTGSPMSVVCAVGLILTIRYYAGDHGIDLGDLDPGTFLFAYVCFLLLGVGFGAAAWLTRRRPKSSVPRALSTST